MLNGIGGRTIAEAKQRMSYVEFLSWAAYIRQRGTLNQGMRNEFLMARLSTQVHAAVGGKPKFDDYMRYQDQKKATIEDVAALFGAVKAEKKVKDSACE